MPARAQHPRIALKRDHVRDTKPGVSEQHHDRPGKLAAQHREVRRVDPLGEDHVRQILRDAVRDGRGGLARIEWLRLGDVESLGVVDSVFA